MIRIGIIAILLVLYIHTTLTGKEHVIYVASISWHTGLIVPSYSLPDSIWPENHDYSGADYLEIGWGDRDFYQHPGFNLWFAFKAVFWPTRTTLHVLPLEDKYLADNYQSTKLVQLDVSDKELEGLSEFLMSHFELNEQGKLIPDEEGIYYNSQFFAGGSTYFFPKNSNVWAATALKRAGFRYIPVLYQTTGMVVNRASRFGETVIDK